MGDLRDIKNVKKTDDKEAQKEIISKIQDALLEEVTFIRNHTDKSTDEKFAQVGVLLDTVKFLENYDKNVKILNQYYLDRAKWDRDK